MDGVKMKELSHLPAVHQLKEHTRFSEVLTTFDISDQVLTNWLNEQIDVIRSKIIKNEFNGETLSREKLITLIFDQLDEKIFSFGQDQLQGVINATGVVLHTNLGRARLSKQAVNQIKHIASSYSTLEYNLETGNRGSRHEIVEEYIKQLTGAEAAMV